ncbi:hypothetical protein K1719_032308 [Acacia pycnantha]|nr:hypothetical protein K1719_032308 [Acacia pycnantha]
MIFSEVDFDWCPFWIQFHGLPYGAFDSENAIKMSNAIGRTVMYEAPRLQDKLSRTFIRTRTLVNIQEPLVTGFWVPCPQRGLVWVTVRYERLQTYCYDCGRIGHQAKNCRFKHCSMNDDNDEDRWGNGLGSKDAFGSNTDQGGNSTILLLRREETGIREKNVKADEYMEFQHGFSISEIPALKILSPGDPQTTTVSLVFQKPLMNDVGETVANGRPKDQGGESASFSLSHDECDNGNMGHLMGDQVHNERRITITEITTLKETDHVAHPSKPISAPNQQPHAEGAKPYSEQSTPVLQDPPSPKFIRQICQPYYTVESPAKEKEIQSAIIPFLGLSPISAVTTGIYRINLKRTLELLEDDQSNKPSKKRLMFLKTENTNLLEDSMQNTMNGTQRINVRKLKKAIRGKKVKRKTKVVDLVPITDQGPSALLDPLHSITSTNIPLEPNDPQNADGCHQATIGAP